VNQDDVFRLRERVASLENQLTELKKSTTSLKPAPADPLAGKGTVRIENQRVRVAVQLTDPRTQQTIWSQQFDRPVGDVLELQSELAVQIAGAMQTEGRFVLFAPKGFEPGVGP